MRLDDAGHEGEREQNSVSCSTFSSAGGQEKTNQIIQMK